MKWLNILSTNILTWASYSKRNGEPLVFRTKTKNTSHSHIWFMFKQQCRKEVISVISIFISILSHFLMKSIDHIDCSDRPWVIKLKDLEWVSSKWIEINNICNLKVNWNSSKLKLGKINWKESKTKNQKCKQFQKTNICLKKKSDHFSSFTTLLWKILNSKTSNWNKKLQVIWICTEYVERSN